MMIALFAMIAFVTNLCSPMATIVKNQFGTTELMGQIGNYANFIAYLVMGIPAGMLIAKYGYKKTALMALVVGIVGIALEYLSGVAGSYAVYLLGAFISGLCMCMLNTVVNPLLNVLGGGGKTGNQLIQLGRCCCCLHHNGCIDWRSYKGHRHLRCNSGPVYRRWHLRCCLHRSSVHQNQRT